MMRETNRHVYVYINPSGFIEGKISLFSLHEKKNDLIPAKIKHLRHDIVEQRHLMELNAHPDGIITPYEYDSYIHLDDGVFVWSDEDSDYVRIE